MNFYERYYRKTVGAVGLTMLLFLLLLNAFALSVAGVQVLLTFLVSSAEIAYALGQIYYALGYLACFMLPVILLRVLIRKRGYPYYPMETSVRLSPYIFLVIPAAITVIFAAASINAYMVNIFDYSDFMSEMMESTSASEPVAYHWILEFLVICLVPGFCEEFLFRGAIQTNLRPFGRSTAILISSLLFCLMHQNAAQTLYTFAAGIILGVVYEKTRSIWSCTALHVLNNLVSVQEGMLLQKAETALEAALWVNLFETALFTVGILCLVILILRFFGKADDLRDGFFGRDLPACDGYAIAPVSSKRAFKLFWTPSMIVFIVICVLEIVALIVLSIFFRSVFT